jgi:SAM-dependent methyltransferase
MLALARSVVPRPVRRAVRDALDAAARLRDRVAGTLPPLTPPVELVDGIGGAWWVGENYLRHFRDLCDLTPDESVLDVGCGVGRMAVPLAGYLSRRGRYDGFDIMPRNVRWCRRAITPRFPNFRFRHADVFNREYNPDGRVSGAEFRFPYPDRSFDFAFLTSVFTHLMPPDAAHYLAELGRVLRPGGRCLATFFLLTPAAERLIEAGRARHTFHPRDGLIRVHSREVPEACVALDEGFVMGAVEAAGLVADPPRYGSWSGRDDGFEFQDVLILRKPA